MWWLKQRTSTCCLPETNYCTILKDMNMKKILLSLLLAFITAIAFAQICPITVTFTSSDESTGIITFDYEFTGFEDRTHKITTVEVNFDDDEGYQQIPGEYLSGDYPDVGGSGPTFSGTIEWDGAASFPDRYQDQTKIRVKAEQHYISGDGVTDIDGNEYRTVIIGNQEWMAENLRVTKYNNEDDITTGLNDEDWGDTTEGAYAIYPYGSLDGLTSDNDVLEAYGALYNGYAVVDDRGLCPEDWSVPSDSDWTALVDYIVDQGFPNEPFNSNGAGYALKSCLQEDSPLECCDTSLHPRWNSHDPHSGFDEFGFSALPGGNRYGHSGSIGNVGDFGYWWSTTDYMNSSVWAWYRHMPRHLGRVDRFHGRRVHGMSVRCFKTIE